MHLICLVSFLSLSLLYSLIKCSIISHWCWYAPGTWQAFMELLPLLIIYLFITPLVVRRYAMVMSLGKPNPRAMSLTIEYMDHNEQALHQVAELILDSKAENESIEDVFNDWDINGDKELSFKELNEAMLATNMHMQKVIRNTQNECIL